MDIKQESLKLHEMAKGKIEVVARVSADTQRDLSLAYTPGVAAPCLEIERDPNKSYTYTRRGNLVLVVTDGSAVLGLGDIGPVAGMPVMEGKCVLFKAFADVDAFPLCISSKSVDEIVNTIKLISGSFGGVNLEDISAPRCFEIERRLKQECDIPIFHDDQHGTAVVAAAALVNALRIVAKSIEDIKITINGAGAAGTSVAKMLLEMGAKDITMCDIGGIIHKNRNDLDDSRRELAALTNKTEVKGTLADAMIDSDVFIGLSAPGVVTADMVKSMNNDSIVLAMSNPTPEIFPDEAKAGGARIIGTGRSDFPNQINNVLAFPGIFRGALDSRASDINEPMKLAAVYAIAGLVSESELCEDYIVPSAFDKRVGPAVGEAVAKAARESGVAR